MTVAIEKPLTRWDRLTDRCELLYVEDVAVGWVYQDSPEQWEWYLFDGLRREYTKTEADAKGHLIVHHLGISRISVPQS